MSEQRAERCPETDGNIEDSNDSNNNNAEQIGYGVEPDVDQVTEEEPVEGSNEQLSGN